MMNQTELLDKMLANDEANLEPTKGSLDAPYENQTDHGVQTNAIASAIATEKYTNNVKMTGLTSEKALLKLHEDIEEEIGRIEHEFSKRKFVSWLIESLSFGSELSKMRWPSVVFMTAQVIAHLIVEFVLDVDNLATNWVGLQGFILAGLLLLNLAINLWDTKLRSKELLIKAQRISKLVLDCSRDKRLLKHWKKDYCKSLEKQISQIYTLFIPQSPCVHRSLTYRDNSCLNLPDYLLVKGDIIHLFPGDKAPGDCVRVEQQGKIQRMHLEQGQILRDYAADMDSHCELGKDIKRDINCGIRNQMTNTVRQQVDHAKLRHIQAGSDFVMQSTPYIKSLRLSLQKNLKRPVNSVEKECFIITRKYFETFVIPMVFVLSTFVTAIHYGYLDLTDSDHKIKTISIAYLLLRPSLTIMPFLPWMFPFIWLMVNAYGSARLLCVAEAQKLRGSVSSSSHEQHQTGENGHGMTGYRATTKMENLLSTPTAAGSSSAYKNDDDDLHDIKVDVSFTKIFKIFLNLVRGQDGHVWRSSSLLQVLGSLTSLCCIDKVGILSWPNPIPEKIFILPSPENDPANQQQQQQQQHEQQHQKQQQQEKQQQHSDITHQNQEMQDKQSDQQTVTPDDGHSETSKICEPINDRNDICKFNDVMGSKLSAHTDCLLTPLSHNANATFTSIRNSIAQDNASNQLMIRTNLNHNNHRPEVLDISQNLSFATTPSPAAQQANNHKHHRHRNSIDYNRQKSIKPCSLQFDDLNWRNYINCLKPLGLGIALNNCCEESFNDYYRFFKHVTYQSISHCKLTPVIKRRCMCELSRLIGFSNDSTQNYKLKCQIGIHKLTEWIPANARQLNATTMTTTTTTTPNLGQDGQSAAKLKFPFPNMTCNIHQDRYSGSYQMFSQGTADIVLDLCHEFWDGKKLVQLDDAHRKKVMDFYQRTSLTSYCSAFSYGAILEPPKLKNRCIQLSSQSNYGNSKKSITLRKLYNDYHENYLIDQLTNGADSISYKTRRHLSFDDLTELVKELPVENVNGDHRNDKQHDLSQLMDELSDQIFVGMVATQYQACPDFVALVEQLEHACIRFIHFSRENELRSRVFSEKMGLESGWNCHISLQSDETFGQELSRANESRDDQGLLDQNTEFQRPDNINNILSGKANPHNNNNQDQQSLSSIYTLYSWKSLPSLVMKLSTRLMSLRANEADRKQHNQRSMENNKDLEANLVKFKGELNLKRERSDNNLEDNNNNGDDYTDVDDPDLRVKEEQNQGAGLESLVFDMSNRAKLPKGIENIRPHLETVDNVPLQVSLFTDCTPQLTKEMIEIMQDYGEIVCVLGSSSSVINTSVFLQANASIAIEPLKPQFCAHRQRHRNRKSKACKTNSKSLQRSEKKTHDKKRSDRRVDQSELSSVNPVIVDQNYPDLQQQQQQQQQSRLFNKPRDRLGMGVENGELEKQQPIMTVAQRRVSKLSSSSSSSSSSTSLNATGQLQSTISLMDNSSAINDGHDVHDNVRFHDPSQKKSISTPRNASSSPSSSSPSTSSSPSSSESSSDDSDAGSNSSDSDSDDELLIDGSRNLTSSLLDQFPEPMALASALTSLPCSYNFDRRNPINLYALIMEARHFTFKMKNTFVCMICFALSISSAQFLASLLFLPPMYSSGSTIWLTIVVVPIMSLPLMSTTMESQVMKIAVGKNLQLKPENITFFVICYLIKFIPSIIVVVLCFGLIIDHSCKLTGFGSSSLGPCWMFTYVKHGNDTTPDTDKEEDLLWYAHLLTAQMSSAFLTVLYFVVISSGFVHRSQLIWQRTPTTNHKWVLTSIGLITFQLLYSQLFLKSNLDSSDIPYQFLASLPLHIWIISFAWPVIAIAINLLVKRAEIKATIRQQRRARFDFNTKLGMNSPF